MSLKMKGCKRIFQASWQELEKRFRDGDINPQQENDVVCFLYYAIAKRFEKKGWSLSNIRTEDTRYIRGQQLRADINLNDRLFVEVKMYPLRKYTHKGWMTKKQNIKVHVEKLEEYVKEVKSTRPSVLEREPALALWFWKRDTVKLIDENLEDKLEKIRDRYKGRVSIIYGPRKRT